MKKTLASTILILSLCLTAAAQDVTRVGIIGLDTSHSPALTKLLNTEQEVPVAGNYRVVAAYPYGTKTIESAASRIPRYIEEVKGMGVEIVDSIESLLDKVDCVFIETNDGHLHLEQAEKVFKAGKKCYIDKPLGATLAQCIAIYSLAERYGIPIFSASALRFSKVNAELRDGVYGPVKGADCYSPHNPEKTHPDFGYYGLHGVETLFTILGTGCEKVSRLHGVDSDIVTGLWSDGRLGTFRAVYKGGSYGGTVLLEDKKMMPAGGYEGYRCLLDAIIEFFETGIPPVSKEETLEIFAFMEASNLSMENDGRSVRLETVMTKAAKEARKLLKKY